MARQRSTSLKNPETSEAETACRLDVWLFRTRLQKTRTGAARLITDGKVRITRNGVTERTKKAHTLVRPGDGVTFMRGKELLSIRMNHAGTRRGPAPEAQTLYEVLENPVGKT